MKNEEGPWFAVSKHDINIAFQEHHCSLKPDERLAAVSNLIGH